MLFVFLTFALLLGIVNAVVAENYQEPDGQSISWTETAPLPEIGQVIYGFEALEIRDFPMINASVVRFVHQKTGAQLYYIANDDIDRVFDLTFRTEAPDDTGIPHVFEHAILSGSEKYPSAQLYSNLNYQTYNTYMNAYTYHRYTSYPVSSMSEAQLLKLADFYTDSCFHPMVMEDESIFRTEAWRYRLNDPDDPLSIEGTVYSEMLGKRSVERSSYMNALKAMFPGTTVGNDHGGDPEFIPDLTWQRLKEYHEEHYHPSNCIAYIYGRFEDPAAFLELLDGYFSAYEKKEFTYVESGYEPLSEPVVQSLSFPVEQGSNTEHASIIYYGIVCPGLREDREQELVLNTLTDLLNDAGSVLARSFQEALPYGDLHCYIETFGPDDAIVFIARNVDPGDADVFRQTVDKALADTAENGFLADQVDSVMTSMELTAYQAREAGNPVDKVVLPIAEYDALFLEPWKYLDFENSLSQMGRWNEQGLYAKAVSEWLIGKQSTALVTTWPEEGKREVKDAELAGKLAGIKAEMTEEEIAGIVAFSNAEYEYEDTSEMVSSRQAVTVESLPEEWKCYDVHDETVEDGIRHIDVTADTEGIGSVELLLDTSGFDQEDIHWLRLYAGLLTSLDTRIHLKGDLASLCRRYLHDSAISVTSYHDGKEGFHPWLELSWISLDDDLDEGYDLIRELLFETRFDDPDKILDMIKTIQAGYQHDIPDSIEQILVDRSFALCSQGIRYNSYVNGLEYYEFLFRTQKLLQEEPGAVTAKLQGIQAALDNRTNAVVIFAGNESSISLNRSLADKFLARLGANKIERAEYDLPAPDKDEALIIDSGIQYNVTSASYSMMGRDDYEGWMTVAAHLVNDYYLIPILRDRYGVYDPYCANKNSGDGGIYIFTFEDPNIAETFEFIKSLPDMLSKEEIDQEALEGYILESYSLLAKPKGVLSGAIAAAEATLEGKPQDESLTWLRQMKQCTPEKLTEWAKMLRVLADEGAIRTAGGVSAIKTEAERYDKILDPFGTEERKQMDW
ncbi:MAG: insulinase family protein [Blautia sp.]|nr:insulinase family protein [Blautia sp.]